MNTVTWIPGTNSEYDQLFEVLRKQQYDNHEHRLWENYSRAAFTEVAAKTIHFNDDNTPESCSSITRRACWPNNVYRILNRFWKPFNRLELHQRTMTNSIGESTKSQVKWLSANTNCELYFISRQTAGWQEFVVKCYKRDFNLNFKSDMNMLYLTCADECNDTCWQRIIYNGDESILEKWKRK